MATATINSFTVRWTLTILAGTAAAAVVGYIAGVSATNEQFSWLHAVVFALCTAPPLFGFAWLLLVASKANPTGSENAELSVERAWFGRAAESAFLDTMALLGILAFITSFTVFDVSIETLCLLLLASGWADLGIRYMAFSRRDA